MLFAMCKKIAVDVGHILHNLMGNSENEVCPEDKGERGDGRRPCVGLLRIVPMTKIKI